MRNPAAHNFCLRIATPASFLALLFAGCATGEPSIEDPSGASATAMLQGDTELPDELLRPLAGTEALLRVHYPVPTGKSLSVRGSGGPLSWTSGAAMTRASSTLYTIKLRGVTTPLEWKPLVDDSTWSRGNNYRVAPGQTVDIYPHFYTAAGRYERRWASFHSTVLGNDRGVWVYLPPSYDENPLARYPVVYMHDGQNLFDPRYAFLGRTWKVSETLNAGIDALDDSLHLPEVIVIGPENNADRIYEYTPTKGDDPMYKGGGGDLYLRFLVEELKPVIDRELRTRPEAGATALAGSSLGGLISAYAGTKYANVYSRLGVFSPSTWWDNRFLIGAVSATMTPRPQRVYVDSGSPGDDYANTRDLAQKYRDIGYVDGKDLLYVVEAGGQHNEDYWARRLPNALRFLLADL